MGTADRSPVIRGPLLWWANQRQRHISPTNDLGPQAAHYQALRAQALKVRRLRTALGGWNCCCNCCCHGQGCADIDRRSCCRLKREATVDAADVAMRAVYYELFCLLRFCAYFYLIHTASCQSVPSIGIACFPRHCSLLQAPAAV